MKHLMVVISQVEKSLGFEWYAESLDKHKFNTIFVLLNAKKSPLEQHLVAQGFTVIRLHYLRRIHLISAFLKIMVIMLKKRPDIIHAHLFEGCLVSLPVAYLLRIRKRIYTRHHSDFHQTYHPKIVWLDKLINRMSTRIIAVSENVKDVLVNQEQVASEKVSVIHHGFNLDIFEKAIEKPNRLQQYNPQQKYPVVGVISRYVHWKGIQFIIPAFKELLQSYPEALLILANAKGEYKGEVQKMLKTLPSDSFREITFEEDIAGLYSLFDVFVHVPVDIRSEAFGQVYIEALAAGVPSVFTLSGIASDFIVDNKNALVVPFKDCESITVAITELLSNPELGRKISLQGKLDVNADFRLQNMMRDLLTVYEF